MPEVRGAQSETEGQVRRASKTDDNQEAIVNALRAFGASVEIIKQPLDLLVGWHGQTWVMEVKDGTKPPSERKLTPIQEKFFRTWKGGPRVVVECPEDALRAIGALRSGPLAEEKEMP